MALGCFNATQAGNAQPKQPTGRAVSVLRRGVPTALGDVLQSDPHYESYATPTAVLNRQLVDLGYAFIDVVHGRSLTATG